MLGTLAPKLEASFLQACKLGHDETVKSILELGKPSILAPAKIQEGFEEACKHRRLPVVRALIQQPNISEEALQFGFSEACSQGHLDVTNELLANTSRNKSLEPLLYASFFNACKKGHLPIVCRLLLQPNLPEHALKNGLYAACFNGHLEIVNELLTDLSLEKKQPSELRGPFLEACERGHSPIVQKFLDSTDIGQDPNIFGLAYHNAGSTGKLPVIEVLLKHSKKPEELLDGLSMASEKGHLPVVDRLLKNIAIPENQTQINDALQWARRNQHQPVVDRILAELNNLQLEEQTQQNAQHNSFNTP